MPTFDFLPLLWWGLPFAAAPLLIHLINLLRYKRVKFAALEFLLASQRKYRTRVLLKQILLLLLRTAAVLGIVLALAQPRWKHALGTLLGGQRTAHVILIDDSYSMGEGPAGGGDGGATAFDRGRRVAERLVAELAGASGSHELSLGRFSSVATGPSTAAGGFDVVREAVTPTTVQAVRGELAELAPSWSDVAPSAALAPAVEWLGAGTDAARVLWLVSDFRAKDWQGDDDTPALLRRLADAGVELRLVDCALDPPPDAAGNLTVERLEMVGGVPATDVLLPLEVTVRNHSAVGVRDVQVELQEDGVARPGLRIAEIPAGGAATRRFEARFTQSGGHVVEARIPPDTLVADNGRTLAIDVVDRLDVLLIDGDQRGGGRAGDAFYVAAALAPGAGAPTGLRPRIEPPRALATLDLAAFDCVWVLDVERLDEAEVAALEAFARAGGGVVFFAGPRTKAEEVNRTLFRGGTGLFPVPLAGAVDLLADTSATPVPDLVVEDHPVVAVLAGQRNPLLDAVRVERFMAVDRGVVLPPEAGLRRLLSLRTGVPLAVERPFGAGLVVAVLTTAAPEWNNWARGNPSWVVVMLELESHLARIRRRAGSLEVGDPVVVRLEQGLDEIDVDFTVPPDGTLVRQAAAPTAAGALEARLPAAGLPGAYGARWRRLDGTERERVVAVNVDPGEGRLERIGRERLDRALAGVRFRYDRADSLQPETASLTGTPLVKPLLILLAAVLACEQLLAFSRVTIPPRPVR